LKEKRKTTVIGESMRKNGPFTGNPSGKRNFRKPKEAVIARGGSLRGTLMETKRAGRGKEGFLRSTGGPGSCVIGLRKKTAGCNRRGRERGRVTMRDSRPLIGKCSCWQKPEKGRRWWVDPNFRRITLEKGRLNDG